MSSVAQSASATPPRPSSSGRALSLAAAALGLLFAALLLGRIGVGSALGLVARAGWWLPLVVLLHAPQTFASAAGWRALLPAPGRPPLGRLYLFRWIRESVNSLLPVAQVGGEVVRARLLARWSGTGLAWAGASCALDVTLELLAQLGFTLIGLGLLAAAVPRSPMVGRVAAALLALAVLVAGLALAQRLVRVPRLQALLGRLGLRAGREGGTVFRAGARRQVRGALWHFASWTLGALETWAALRAVGVHAGPGEATVVESLGQGVRAAAFAVPGALGVQEGGLVLICGLFGVAPGAAIALSLVRRLRELALGAPGLLAWRLAERRTPASAAP